MLHLFDRRSDRRVPYDLPSQDGSVCGGRASCGMDPEAPDVEHDCDSEGCILRVTVYPAERREREALCERWVSPTQTVRVRPGLGDVRGGRRLRRRLAVQGGEVCPECRSIYEARLARPATPERADPRSET